MLGTVPSLESLHRTPIYRTSQQNFCWRKEAWFSFLHSSLPSSVASEIATEDSTECRITKKINCWRQQTLLTWCRELPKLEKKKLLAGEYYTSHNLYTFLYCFLSDMGGGHVWGNSDSHSWHLGLSPHSLQFQCLRIPHRQWSETMHIPL